MKRTLLLGLGLSALLVGCGDSSSTGDDVEDGGSTATGNPCCDSTGGSGGESAQGGGPVGGSSSTGGGGSAPLPCGDPVTIEDGLSPTAELHVATSGSDQSGDGSAASPFASIDHAASQASPGTAIVVHAGTYPGGAYLSDLAGSDGAPIWIGGAAGEARPVIEGGPNGLHLSRVRYLVIHDLEITGSTANGINADDGADYASEDATRYVVFRDLSIHDIGTGGNNDCLKLSGVNDFWVLGSEIARCGGSMAGSGIDHVGCHRGVVAFNQFEELSGNGVQCKGGSTDIVISANTFIDAGERAVNLGGSTGFEYFRPPLSTSQANAEARRIHVLANLIQGSTASLAFVGCVDCLAANNTIVDPERWPFRILQETTSSGGYSFEPAQAGRVINNLVYFQASVLGAHVNVGGNTDAQSFSFQTNLWYAHDDPGASAPDLPSAEQGGLTGVDPMFAGGGDFHLGAGSPALGAGSALPELSGDRDGACYLAPPSIGAYEAE